MIVTKTPITREDFKEYYALRFEILRKPWSMAKGTEKDDYEPISQHFMAVDDRTGKVVGCVKLFEKEPGVGWFSHLAVAADYQRQGVGKLLMEAVESTARGKGFTTLGCMSRLNVTGYFEKMGYHIAGLPSHYFGTIQVAWMEKKI
jgi:N-acetylglutamate synthase-like GNAT family acetyltransferase